MGSSNVGKEQVGRLENSLEKHLTPSTSRKHEFISESRLITRFVEYQSKLCNTISAPFVIMSDRFEEKTVEIGGRWRIVLVDRKKGFMA